MNDIEAVDQQTAEMARLAASRISAGTLVSFREALGRRLSAYGEHPYLRAWLDLANDGPEAVRAALLDTSDRARGMRSFAPLRSLITQEERDTIMLRLRDTLRD